ncbi:ABC transporter permease [Lactobacillus hominis]|uniref:ABC transporter permease component n=1 Tax=Lactobacillus hominis DSM 23910 = CRBIP 24.179 TaxID=1423758 RepID=I7L604_9LACO|nr:ABC transporter permease [Lactobacillus hominis]KRM84312.1 ABC transporter permease component [Lactobacillus hominis DSM 23910 = CRBIP 24.179]MCT3348219.1 ABC transporter permease [Lactobacillus hominis]CCI81732.1 ABC transporter permease component [Lactobacillus hominis DSM 23910 = CRBIP 24.179]
MNKTWLVAKETYRREVKNWSFLLMIFAPFVFILISFFVGMSSSANFDDQPVGIVSSNQTITQSLKKNDDLKLYKTQVKAKKAYQEKKLSGYLVIKQTDTQINATYYGKKKLSSSIKDKVLPLLQIEQQKINLSVAKLTSQQLHALSKQPQLREKVNDRDLNLSNQEDIKKTSFLFLIIILYFLVLTYSQIMAQDVASEKGTKIMEMIFSSMPGGNYFDGKVIGILMEIVTQLVIYGAMFLGFYYLAPHISGVQDIFGQLKPIIDQVLGQIVSWGLLFTVLGLIIYVIYAAFCGALVVRAEDAGKAVQPLTYLTLIGLFGAMSLANKPDSVITVIFSYVPFLSSFMMPLRLINGKATTFEAILSATILVFFIGFSIWWIRKIYPSLILQTDDNGVWKNMKRAFQGIKE